MRLNRFILCVIIAMTSALTVVGQIPVAVQAQTTATPKNLLRGQEIVQTGTNTAGDTTWGLKNPPRPSPKASVPKVLSFYSVPTGNINPGEEVTLYFAVTGASSVTINGENVIGRNSLTVTPTVKTTYTLVASNGNGTAVDYQMIMVNPAPAKTSTEWEYLSDLMLRMLPLLLVLGFMLCCIICAVYFLYYGFPQRDQVVYSDCCHPYEQYRQPSPAHVTVTIYNGNVDDRPVVIEETPLPEPVAPASEDDCAQPETVEATPKVG